MYSGQRQKFSDLALETQRRSLAKEKNAIFTYSPDFISQVNTTPGDSAYVREAVVLT